MVKASVPLELLAESGPVRVSAQYARHGGSCYMGVSIGR